MLSDQERDVLETGYTWIDDHREDLFTLLEELVARPSVSGEEGTHDDSDTTVGYLWEYLARVAPDIVQDAQRIPEVCEADYVDQPRENVYTILEGAGEDGFVAATHTDVVPPGNDDAWPGGSPFKISRGTVRRVGDTEIALTVDGKTHERTVRENLAHVWDLRDFESAEVLIGRGVYDNKVNSAILVGSLLGLRHALDVEGLALGGDLIHGHLVDEEKAQLGVKNMVGWRDNSDWLGKRYDDLSGFEAIVLEGQYGFVPVVGHRGGINLTITARGKAVHGSTPHLGRNAVLGMSKALSRMDSKEFVDRVTTPFVKDELLGDFTVAPGTTVVSDGVEAVDGDEVDRGGGAEYAVSDWCQATVDCRIPRWHGFPDDADEIHDRFLDLVRAEIEAAAPDLDFEVESNMFFLPIALGEDRRDAEQHPLVMTAKRSTDDVAGYVPDIDVAPGATDAWVIYHGTHIPTLVEYGPAGALSHEPLEYVESEQLIQGAKALLNMAVRRLGVS